MIMGLGTALFEEVVYEDGQVINANLSDYATPAFGDLPAGLTHELLEREGADVHGLGETALPPVPPAIGNAVASLGIDVCELPMKPETVLAALETKVGAA
jgi:CO/xanthine dehydrogenase Mo-binding subunit